MLQSLFSCVNFNLNEFSFRIARNLLNVSIVDVQINRMICSNYGLANYLYEDLYVSVNCNLYDEKVSDK